LYNKIKTDSRFVITLKKQIANANQINLNVLKSGTGSFIPEKINLTEKVNPRLLEEQFSTPIDIYQVHGITLVVGWGFVHILGYCAARFLKHYHWWIYIHLFCTELPALATLIIISIMFSKCKVYIYSSWI
jgi:hypothetical protein